MSASTERSSGLHRVLIVDDTDDVRFMVPLQLRTEGVEFADAASGEEALARCAEEKFDAIVLDYRMPGLSGLDVARELSASGYAAPIVIYSAYMDESLEMEAHDLGIPVVDKADHRRLRELVHAMLDSAGGVSVSATGLELTA